MQDMRYQQQVLSEGPQYMYNNRAEKNQIIDVEVYRN
jgi:hypothetical protein